MCTVHQLRHEAHIMAECQEKQYESLIYDNKFALSKP